MKKLIVALFAVLGVLAMPDGLNAKVKVDSGAGVDNVKVVKEGNDMHVKMNVLLSKVKVPSNKAYLLTPVLVNGDNSKSLPAIGIYSRGRFIQYLRNGSRKLSSAQSKTYSVKDMPGTVQYDETVPFEQWMNGAQLYLRQDEYGCADCKVASSTGDMLGGYNEFKFSPEYVFARPEAEVSKSRSISGKAYVDFGIGKAAVDPAFHNNASELAKIRATIDSVRNDKDITTNSISLKGYASPEGKYSVNESLAKKRTESIRQYVENIDKLNDGIFKTDFVAEDWGGLRDYVAKSSLVHRQEILDLVDDMNTYKDLDAKEWKLKSTCPEDYKDLLDNCYPYLRRTDYQVDYTIRGYVSSEEVAEVLRTNPGKLSLNEFYLAAQNFKSGSADFNNTFIKAVKYYPEDKTANLNAALAEMQEGNLEAAGKYLDKAGNSDLATYAKGVYSALKGKYSDAESFFEKAKAAGVKEAGKALEQLYSRSGRL